MLSEMVDCSHELVIALQRERLLRSNQIKFNFIKRIWYGNYCCCKTQVSLTTYLAFKIQSVSFILLLSLPGMCELREHFVIRYI